MFSNLLYLPSVWPLSLTLIDWATNNTIDKRTVTLLYLEPGIWSIIPGWPISYVSEVLWYWGSDNGTCNISGELATPRLARKWLLSPDLSLRTLRWLFRNNYPSWCRSCSLRPTSPSLSLSRIPKGIVDPAWLGKVQDDDSRLDRSLVMVITQLLTSRSLPMVQCCRLVFIEHQTRLVRDLVIYEEVLAPPSLPLSIREGNIRGGTWRVQLRGTIGMLKTKFFNKSILSCFPFTFSSKETF